MKLTLDREHAPTTVAMVVAILMLAAAFLLMVLPKPKEGLTEQKIKGDTFAAKKDESNAIKAADKLKPLVANQTWSGSGADIAPTVLALLSKIAAKHNVQLVSLRPQRTVVAGDLTQSAYLINLTGAFPDVLAFERELDKPDSRLAVENTQLGAADETTDNVTGTLAVEAYMLTPAPTTTTTTTTRSKNGKNPPKPGTTKSAVPGTDSIGSNVKA